MGASIASTRRGNGAASAGALPRLAASPRARIAGTFWTSATTSAFVLVEDVEGFCLKCAAPNPQLAALFTSEPIAASSAAVSSFSA